MAFTGRLGTDDSQLGNIELGAEGGDNAPERTATDAPSTSESAVRTNTAVRTSADAPTVSDSAVAEVTAAGVVNRTATDAVATSESASRIRLLSRTTTDAVTTSESAVEAVTKLRTAADAPTMSDAATWTRSKFRTVTDGSTEYCLDFASGFPGDWANDGFVATGGEIVTGPGEFDSMEYTGDTPTGPTTVQFDFRTPNPIGDDYWFIEVDTYGLYVFVDNWFTTLGDTFGLYVLGDQIEIPFDLTANTYYTVKLYADQVSGTSRTKIWLRSDPEPEDWMLEHVHDGGGAEWPWSIFYEIDGAGSGAVDNVCWTTATTVTDSVDRQLDATRQIEDTTETEEWPLHNFVVDTPVYGQDPNGYQPELAAPINNSQTTITVTQPLPPGTQLPILVYINGEYVLVTAVSPDGLTWTVVRGYNGSSGASHSTGSILPANTTLAVGGVQIGAFVDFRRTRLATYANGNVGTGEIWIRDVDRVMSFTTGAEVVVRHRNVRVWGGYIANIKRAYAFGGGSGDPDDEPRYLVLEVVDYNILFRKRIYYDRSDPTHMQVRTWPNGTADDLVIGNMVNTRLDLGDDGLSYDIHHVGTPGLPVDSCNPDAPDRFQIAWAGYTWGDAMRAIADQTGGIYYIDPDKVFRYVDDSVKQSVFGYSGLSDDPGGTVIGYRDFELSRDATKLVNEQFTWGVGQGATQPVLGHATAPGSIADHGLWQQAELRYDMYCQGTVNLRANTWLDGSPQNHRGYKNDHLAVRATVFTPYFRVADVISVESTSFDFADVIPVRGMEITFPTPWDIQCVMTISHEYDSPWEAYEFAFPRFPFDFNIPRIGPWDFIPQFPPGDDCAEPGGPCSNDCMTGDNPEWSFDGAGDAAGSIQDGDTSGQLFNLGTTGGSGLGQQLRHHTMSFGCEEAGVVRNLTGNLTPTGDYGSDAPTYRVEFKVEVLDNDPADDVYLMWRYNLGVWEIKGGDGSSYVTAGGPPSFSLVLDQPNGDITLTGNGYSYTKSGGPSNLDAGANVRFGVHRSRNSTHTFNPMTVNVTVSAQDDASCLCPLYTYTDGGFTGTNPKIADGETTGYLSDLPAFDSSANPTHGGYGDITVIDLSSGCVLDGISLEIDGGDDSESPPTIPYYTQSMQLLGRDTDGNLRPLIGWTRDSPSTFKLVLISEDFSHYVDHGTVTMSGGSVAATFVYDDINEEVLITCGAESVTVPFPAGRIEKFEFYGFVNWWGDVDVSPITVFGTLSVTGGVAESDAVACEETFTRSVTDGIGTSEAPGGAWTDSEYFSVDGDELVVQRPSSPTGPLHSQLVRNADLPFEIMFEARWEKDFGTDPGPPHGPSSGEAYGRAFFRLWTADEEGDTPFTSIPREGLGFRLNRDSDTLEDYVTVTLDGEGPGPSDGYSTGGFVPNLISATTPFKVRWRLEEEHVYLRVWEASSIEPVDWDVDFDKDFLSASYNAWAFFVSLADDPLGSIGFVEGARLYITNYVLEECTPLPEGYNPCEGILPGELEDPIDDGALYGVSPAGGVELDNGNFLYTFDQQFLAGSTEVWADGLRLRVVEDYDEHPLEAAIEIHSDAQSGFTTFDPGMSIIANMIPFVIHDPPPEYVEP